MWMGRCSATGRTYTCCKCRRQCCPSQALMLPLLLTEVHACKPSGTAAAGRGLPYRASMKRHLCTAHDDIITRLCDVRALDRADPLCPGPISKAWQQAARAYTSRRQQAAVHLQACAHHTRAARSSALQCTSSSSSVIVHPCLQASSHIRGHGSAQYGSSLLHTAAYAVLIRY